MQTVTSLAASDDVIRDIRDAGFDDDAPGRFVDYAPGRGVIEVHTDRGYVTFVRDPADPDAEDGIALPYDAFEVVLAMLRPHLTPAT